MQIEGKETERLTAGRIELGAHPPLLGVLNDAGELVEAAEPGFRAWKRRPGEKARHFEQRIIDDVAAFSRDAA